MSEKSTGKSRSGGERVAAIFCVMRKRILSHKSPAPQKKFKFLKNLKIQVKVPQNIENFNK